MTASYIPHYFSIEDIMISQERLPCQTEVLIPRLGFLNVGSEKEDLDIGTQLELPFWLTEKLVQKHQTIISSDIPKVYKEKTRDIFEADAKIVDLFRINSNFYEFGLYLINLNHKESELIRGVLVQAFKERFRVIMDWSDNVMTEANKIQQLDNSEKALLKVGHKGRNELDIWLTEGISQIKASDMVIKLRKRKLVDMETA